MSFALQLRSIISVLSGSLLMFIFVPKILYYRLAKKNKTSTKQAIQTSLVVTSYASTSDIESDPLKNDGDSRTHDWEYHQDCQEEGITILWS